MPAGPASDGNGDPEPDLDALARDAGDAARRVSAAIAGGTLVVLHGVVGWFTLTLGLVAPLPAVVAMLAVWAVVGVTAWRQRARRPILTMLAPFATAGFVLAMVALGGELLGWSA